MSRNKINHGVHVNWEPIFSFIQYGENKPVEEWYDLISNKPFFEDGKQKLKKTVHHIVFVDGKSMYKIDSPSHTLRGATVNKVNIYDMMTTTIVTNDSHDPIHLESKSGDIINAKAKNAIMKSKDKYNEGPTYNEFINSLEIPITKTETTWVYESEYIYRNTRKIKMLFYDSNTKVLFDQLYEKEGISGVYGFIKEGKNPLIIQKAKRWCSQHKIYEQLICFNYAPNHITGAIRSWDICKVARNINKGAYGVGSDLSNSVIAVDMTEVTSNVIQKNDFDEDEW